MHDEAIEEFKRAIQLSGDNEIFNANLAYAYAASGRQEEATKMVRNWRTDRITLLHRANIALILCRARRSGPGDGSGWTRPIKRASTRPSSCGRPSIPSDPTLGSRISCAVSAVPQAERDLLHLSGAKRACSRPT